MPADVKLFQTKDYWDIDFQNGDIHLTDSLDTALYMSIFCETRAKANEIANALDRRGHFSNIFNEVEGYEIGSKFWLYTERARNTQQNAELIKMACSSGLQWLIDDNVIQGFKIDVMQKTTQIQLNITLEISPTETLYKEALINTFK
jgi:phage gp46-like protein